MNDITKGLATTLSAMRARRRMKMIRITRKKLVAACEVWFPGSVILTRKQVMDRWLLNPEVPGHVGRTYADNVAESIASALLQHTVIVFYEYGKYRGARYGLDAPEYISGFGEKR